MMATERTAPSTNIGEEECNESNIVFLFGDRQESAVYAATLMEYFRSIILNPSNNIEDISKWSSARRNRILVNTKYYSATLLLNLGSLEVPATFQHKVCDGVIIILSEPLDTCTLDRFKSFVLLDERISLQLLILLKENDEDSRYSDVSGEYSLWCIDHGFEMIEISKSNISESYDSRDKVGLPRVMEAIESTIWRYTSSTRATTSQQSKQEIKGAKYCSSSSNDHHVSQYHAAATVATTTSESVFVFSDTAAESSSSSFSTKSTEETPVPPTSSTADRIEEASSSSSLPDSEDNATFDTMDSFLSQAVRWREKVAIGMDDSERREQASVLALQLSQLMGLIESDDDDDDDDSD